MTTEDTKDSAATAGCTVITGQLDALRAAQFMKRVNLLMSAKTEAAAAMIKIGAALSLKSGLQLILAGVAVVLSACASHSRLPISLEPDLRFKALFINSDLYQEPKGGWLSARWSFLVGDWGNAEDQATRRDARR